MSVVFQDYCRFQMSVKKTLEMSRLTELGNPKAIRLAAQRSGADGFISELQHGYDAMLGKMFESVKNGEKDGSAGEVDEDQPGVELSGGEWQKIALARAFMRSLGLSANAAGCPTEAQVVVLDEPTASLDVQSEHDVYCRFHELTKDKMALLITHRFSTVRIATKFSSCKTARSPRKVRMKT